jgi:hypothetical protein
MHPASLHPSPASSFLSFQATYQEVTCHKISRKKYIQNIDTKPTSHLDLIKEKDFRGRAPRGGAA